MASGVRIPGRDRTAIVLSIAVHICALVALATTGRLMLAPDAPDEKAVRASLIRIERRPPAVTRIARVAAAPAPDHQAFVAPPQLHVLHAVAASTRATLVQNEHRYLASAQQRTSPDARRSTVTTMRAAYVGRVVPVPDATAAPAAPVTVAQETAHDDGIGNFGENYPAKVDPQTRGGLFAGVPDNVLMRIEVDENGHVTAVVFLRGPADESIKEELRSRILAARLIPAACNGLRCSDTIEIRN